jgi:serine/threonine protein kinase
VTLDPIALADLVLALATRGTADMIFIEPHAESEDTAYTIACERGDVHIGSIEIDGATATAMIARLALIAKLDLASPAASGGIVRTALGTIEAETVVTLRQGATLRADVAALPRRRSSRPTMGEANGPLPGAVIGSYRVIERLGEGGMGTVFRAEHVVLGNHRALKVLRAKLVEGNSTAAHRFLREARAAARVHHTNIVEVFDFGYLTDGRPYFVMEILDGESLLDLIDRGPLAPSEAIAIARQLATALAAAHDAGVIHADVTPANAYVTSREPLVVKLLDFGLAELVGETARTDEPSEFVLGTPSYISPEQLRGLPVTDRSDQYSLGAILFEMLSGQPPYVDTDLRKLCMKHVTAPIPEVTSKYGPLPTALTDVITTCLQKAPASRFPGMRALIAALDELERVADRRGWRRFLPT